MKGIILHGGAGTRLRPITHTGPKQLIPIGNKPMSQYTLEYLTDSGIKDIAIILGDIYPDKVKDYYGDGTKFNCKITYIDQGMPLGIAQAISLTEEFVKNDKFVVILGDNLIDDSIDRSVKKFEYSDYDTYLLFSESSHPKDFGVAKFSSSGKLIGLIEKPKEPPSNFVITGIYFFKPVIYEHIKKLKPSWRNEYEITEAIQFLMNSGGKIGYDIIEGWWKDTGTVEDILAANRLVLDKIKINEERKNVQGKVIVGKNVKISDDSMIRGPAIIGDNTIIENKVFIGPYTSIGDNCKIKNASIENSIIMRNSLIETENMIIDSIIGENSYILNANSLKPRGLRMIVGENSKLHL
ncbi:MAG: glucose-1-phosphate thymidylyltransferase [Candidatus Parvarchaeota archaeon]